MKTYYQCIANMLTQRNGYLDKRN